MKSIEEQLARYKSVHLNNQSPGQAAIAQYSPLSDSQR